MQPGDPLTRWWLRAVAWCRRAGTAFDLVNTRFPPGAAAVRDALKPICRVPRMSTPAVGALINHGVARMAPGESFVNVGVWHGFTLLSGMAGNRDRACVGIDNFSQFGGPKAEFLARFERFRSPQHHFYDMDYRDYFATVHRGAIGFYLYDGEHSYTNQLEGLRAAEPFFAPNCVVMVDDTNTAEPRAATAEFVRTSRHRFETILDATTCDNQHPTWWNGVMLLRQVG
jgi:hypothetical protein